jgi:hypothetical protein
MNFDIADFIIKLITTLAVFAVWALLSLFDLIWP